MKRQILCWTITCLFTLLPHEGHKETIRGADEEPWKGKAFAIEKQTEENLLVNDSMEDGFYWLPPNHFIANGWERWWRGNLMHEYDDGHKYHSRDGEHSQRHHGWGPPTTGIFQKVSVSPCLRYQFSMYGLNSSGKTNTNHHARIGIDPLGRGLGIYISTLPTEIVWSPDQTFWRKWGQHTVQAETHHETITVITYISPENPDDYYDTYWDMGKLIVLPFPNDRLPAPNSWQASDLITNVTSTQSLDTLTVKWETTEPALSQIWYTVITPTRRSDPIGTLLFPSIYLPLVIHSRPETEAPTFTLATPPDLAYTTTHQASLRADLGRIVKFAILARRPVDNQCQTESSSVFQFKMVKPTPPPPTP